jgi:hypothetical protein
MTNIIFGAANYNPDIQEIPRFYETLRLISMDTRVYHWHRGLDRYYFHILFGFLSVIMVMIRNKQT